MSSATTIVIRRITSARYSHEWECSDGCCAGQLDATSAVEAFELVRHDVETEHLTRHVEMVSR